MDDFVTNAECLYDNFMEAFPPGVVNDFPYCGDRAGCSLLNLGTTGFSHPFSLRRLGPSGCALRALEKWEGSPNPR
ncbi:MAG: hypothetical protein CM1200mP26_02700 [Acidimicrobiales bacterium]|nr:MAG: hypothetical protein CM1200mP26_02700 [Acidimicrobiales bacterium]